MIKALIALSNANVRENAVIQLIRALGIVADVVLENILIISLPDCVC